MRTFKANLVVLLKREPAAFGSLAASVLPVLVLMGVIRIDEAGIAAVVVAVNTVVGLGTRLVVSPLSTQSAPAAGEGEPVVA